MVSRLARQIVRRYATPGGLVLDPFCGSGTILLAAAELECPVFGIDLNPYAVLLTRVKLESFDGHGASQLLQRLRLESRTVGPLLPIELSNKDYWFTGATLRKFERLRYIAARDGYYSNRNGRAVLLALTLAVRRCSRADQRSPKPFISHIARRERSGRHFDPVVEAGHILNKIAAVYAGASRLPSRVRIGDVTHGINYRVKTASVITSPPYINAQDYYRNVKLELSVLENVIPFETHHIKDRFIGTDRGDLLRTVTEQDLLRNEELLPHIKRIEANDPRSAQIVHRYLTDMWNSFSAMQGVLQRSGRLVIVCGDNVVAGEPIPTWKILNEMITALGFKLFDRFGDRINRRMLAPKRNGHKALIKEEVVSVFTRI